MQKKTDRQDNENMTAKTRSGDKRTGDNDAGAGHLGQESRRRV
jgi:ribosomal protein L15